MKSADRLKLAQLLAQKKRDAAREFVRRAHVAALFEHQVAKSPDAVACIADDDTRLTYAELNSRANRLAYQLLGADVGPGMRVAVCSRRSPDFVAGLLAIFKVGAVYLPVDPNYPAGYLQRIFLNAEPSVVLTSSALRERVLPFVPRHAETLCLDGDSLSGPVENLGVDVSSDAWGCLAYTSGSTGEPKGVMVPQRQILNLLHGLWDLIPFQPDDIVAQKTSSAFVVSLKEFLAGLLAGVPQALIGEAAAKDPEAFVEALRRHRATRLNIVPSHLKAVLAVAGRDPQALAALKHCITAGEPLTHELRRQVHETLPWVELWNNFGCTELNDITYCAPPEQDGAGTFVPIGRPILNTNLYVLDRDLHQVPPGVAGELCVHSIGMGDGYWRQPAMTAQRFVPDPFSGQPGARLYRTGDLVRYRDDGVLEFLGRKDFEMKVRGQRVDVHHVEEVLAQHPAVGQAVVSAWPAGHENPQLVAYHVPRTAGSDDPGTVEAPVASELRAFLVQRLPDFMVPTFYVPIDRFPRLPNGKLNRRALPAPSRSALPSAAYQEPQGEVETRLAEMWKEVLKVNRVGRNDNFFDLGGHSLLGAQLIAKIHQHFNVEFPLTELFGTPTVAALAQAIDAARAGAPDEGYEVIAKADRTLQTLE